MSNTPAQRPIAYVINNNQEGWKNIIETAPNVTLPIGTALYLAPTEPLLDADGRPVEHPVLETVRRVMQELAIRLPNAADLDRSLAELSRVATQMVVAYRAAEAALGSSGTGEKPETQRAEPATVTVRDHSGMPLFVIREGGVVNGRRSVDVELLDACTVIRFAEYASVPGGPLGAS